MKKFVSSIVAATMLLTSNVAFARDPRWGVDSNRHSPYYGQTYRDYRDYDRGHRRHRNGVSTGEAVAIGIGALILGAAISNSNRNTRVERNTYPVQRPQQYVCQDVIQYDYYGNPYVAGRNCWYQ